MNRYCGFWLDDTELRRYLAVQDRHSMYELEVRRLWKYCVLHAEKADADNFFGHCSPEIFEQWDRELKLKKVSFGRLSAGPSGLSVGTPAYGCLSSRDAEKMAEALSGADLDSVLCAFRNLCHTAIQKHQSLVIFRHAELLEQWQDEPVESEEKTPRPAHRGPVRLMALLVFAFGAPPALTELKLLPLAQRTLSCSGFCEWWSAWLGTGRGIALLVFPLLTAGLMLAQIFGKFPRRLQKCLWGIGFAVLLLSWLVLRRDFPPTVRYEALMLAMGGAALWLNRRAGL